MPPLVIRSPCVVDGRSKLNPAARCAAAHVLKVPDFTWCTVVAGTGAAGAWPPVDASAAGAVRPARAIPAPATAPAEPASNRRTLVTEVVSIIFFSLLPNVSDNPVLPVIRGCQAWPGRARGPL